MDNTMNSALNEPGEATENEKILGTMKFYDDSQTFIEQLKDGLKKLNLQGLENSNFINLENTTGGTRRQDFAGVKTAQQILLKDSQSKELLYAFAQLESIQKKKPEVSLLLAHSNVKFARQPFDLETIVDLLKGKVQQATVAATNLEQIATDELNHNVAHILHRLRKPTGHENDPASYEAGNLAEVMANARNYFPALANRTDSEALEFLYTTRKAVPVEMLG